MALNSTTLTNAIGVSDTSVVLGSVATLVVGDLLFVDGEGMSVLAVPASGTQVPVMRGAAGSQVAHAAGLTVYTGNPSKFYTRDPVGRPPSLPIVTPWINVSNGSIWTVLGSAWVLSGGAGAIDLTSEVVGVLPAASGGTGAASSSAAVATTVLGVGVLPILAAVDFARRVLIHVRVATVFADGDGTQPTVTIGETDSLTKFAAAAVFTDAAAAAVFTFAGTVTAGKALVANLVAGTGATETGTLAITALALP